MPKGDRPPHPLEKHQAMALLQQPNPECRTGARDRALLTVLYRCGLRSNEARSLEVDHIVETPRHELRVLQPKGVRNGNRFRSAGLDGGTWEVLQQWLDVRGRHPGFIFDSKTGAKLDAKNFRSMLQSRARKAGIMRRVHPHCLRHTFASELYHEGVGMLDIMNLMGHRRLDTTALYLQNIGCSKSLAITCEREFSIE